MDFGTLELGVGFGSRQGGGGAPPPVYDPEFLTAPQFNDVAGATGAEPWMSTFLFGTTLTGGSPAGTSSGMRHLPANSDRVVKAHDGYLGENAYNGGSGVSADTIATVLAANGHTDVALHKVSDGTLKLRSYLIPGGEGEFEWDQGNSPADEQYAIAGMLNTARDPRWNAPLSELAPISLKKRFNRFGRGYLNSSWLFPYPDETSYEIDIMEAAIDDGNLSAGFFFFYNAKGPSAASTVYEITPGLLGAWHVFDLVIEGSDMVFYRNGLERYRTTDASAYVDDRFYFMETMEGGGADSFPGLFLGDDSPRGQPAAITTGDTPNPAEIELDYIRANATLIRPQPANSTHVILGGGSDYLVAADNAALDFAGDFTVLLHFQPDLPTFSPSKYPVLFLKNTGGVGYLVQFGAFENEIWAAVEAASTRYYATDPVSTWGMLDGRRYTYGIGREGDQVYLFIEGCRFGPFPATDADLSNSSPFYIGNYSGAGDADGAVAGLFYHGAAYSRLLTAEEAWHFAETVPTAGRVAYWPCNEGSGSTIADADGTADITISGATWSS